MHAVGSGLRIGVGVSVVVVGVGDGAIQKVQLEQLKREKPPVGTSEAIGSEDKLAERRQVKRDAPVCCDGELKSL